MDQRRPGGRPGSNFEVSHRLRLIINADDFGASSEINRAVVQAHLDGVLTSASLIVSGPATAEAVELARGNRSLAVGLHLVLAEGQAVLPKRLIPHLVDEQGRFPDSCGWAGLRHFCRPAARRELRDELYAQFERFAATGLALSHVDGHHHYHLHPAVFPEVVRLAVLFGARGIRLPGEEPAFSDLDVPMRMLERLSWAVAFRLLGSWGRRFVSSTALFSARPSLGLMDSGALDEERLLEIVSRVRSPLSEVYLHPTVGPRLHRLGANRSELDALLSPAVRRTIAERGLRLTNYRDLPDD
jgi:chitin disaccharide deacetylase